MRWLLRASLRLVPRSLRDAVHVDLEDEARAAGRSGPRADLWCAWQATRMAPRLRIALIGDAMLSDLKHTVRSLLHARWFTAGAIVTFAVGIGVNVAVFAAVDRMLFRPLPYNAADRLYFMEEVDATSGQAFGTLPAICVVEGRRLSGIEDLAFIDLFPMSVRLSADAAGDALVMSSATFNILSVTGVRPLIGRSFMEDDARQHRVLVLLSFEAWQRRFGSRSDILDVPLWQGRNRVQIAGVLPRGFVPPNPTTPTRWDGFALNDELMEAAGPGDRSARPVVRLRAGVPPQRVEAELNAIAATVAPPTGGIPGAPRQPNVQLTPLGDRMFKYYRPYMWLIVAATGLVLAMACANLASLLLVRARAREHQTAMSMALGASRRRVAGIALTEALLLSLGGGAVGLVVLAWVGEWLRAVMPPVFVTFSAPLYDTRVLSLSLLLTSLTAVAAALGPALRSARVDILPVLQRTGARGGGGLKGGASLLFIEAALGVILVAGAVMAGRSLVGLFQTDVGFEPRSLRRVAIMFDTRTDEALRFRRSMDALGILRAMPGVTVAGAAEIDPLSGAVSAPFGKGYERLGQRWLVTDGYFDAMGIRVHAGRTISRQDVESQAPVAVLSVLGLRLVLPEVGPASAIGRTVQFQDEAPREIVGVVGDMRVTYASELVPSIYVPTSSSRFRFLMYVARTAPGATVDRAALRERVREQIAEPTNVGVGEHQTLDLWTSTRDDRFRAVLFGTFGFLGLLLAGLGLYAVVSCEVGMRRTEMAIRATLGATRGTLKWGIVRGALRPVFAGAVLGLLAAYWGSQFLQPFLRRVDARDPWTLMVVTVVLLGATALAAWIPARRAARTDPAVVLRSQ